MVARTLPQLSGEHVFLTDGGLETTLIFLQGVALPDFAAFPLLDSEDGRATLDGYFTPYLDLAARVGTGFLLDTPTWRANRDWAAGLGYDERALAEVNRRAVEHVDPAGGALAGRARGRRRGDRAAWRRLRRRLT